MDKALQLADLPGETWKPVRSFESEYEVSNKGRIKSLLRTKIRRNGRPVTTQAKIRRIHHTKVGFVGFGVRIPHRNYVVKLRVSHLVFETFVGPIPPGYEVKHRDGDTHNNTECNLVLRKALPPMDKPWRSDGAQVLHDART